MYLLHFDKVKSMKVLIIGLGSIGQRHKKVLINLGCFVKTLSRREGLSDFLSIENAFTELYDFVVICNETALHIPTILKVRSLKFTGPIFIEKPLSIGMKDVLSISNDPALWVCYNLRFHPVLLKLQEHILTEKKLYYAHLHVGQILSSWRKGREHLKTYSALKKLGGGVVHDLSHEIDWAQWLLGPFSSIQSYIRKLSNETYDSEDFCLIIASNERCPIISINLNYLDKNPTRFSYISGEFQIAKVDLINSEIKLNNEVWTFFDGMNESYINMWNEALDICKGLLRKNFCNIQEAILVQSSIQDIFGASS